MKVKMGLGTLTSEALFLPGSPKSLGCVVSSLQSWDLWVQILLSIDTYWVTLEGREGSKGREGATKTGPSARLSLSVA